jgi:hypothetical protein
MASPAKASVMAAALVAFVTVLEVAVSATHPINDAKIASLRNEKIRDVIDPFIFYPKKVA